jgi:hypothetical protein
METVSYNIGIAFALGKIARHPRKTGFILTTRWAKELLEPNPEWCKRRDNQKIQEMLDLFARKGTPVTSTQLATEFRRNCRTAFAQQIKAALAHGLIIRARAAFGYELSPLYKGRKMPRTKL